MGIRMTNPVPANEWNAFSIMVHNEVDRAREMWAQRAGDPHHDDQHTANDFLVIANKYLSRAMFDNRWDEREGQEDIIKAAAMLFEAYRRVKR